MNLNLNDIEMSENYNDSSESSILNDPNVTQTTESHTSKCSKGKVTLYLFIGALIFLVVLLLILTIVGFSLYYSEKDKIIDNAKNAMTKICDYAKNLQYNYNVVPPTTNGIYEQSLANALIEVCFAVDTAFCTGGTIANLPIGYTDSTAIYGKNPIGGKNTLYAYTFWNNDTENFIIAFTSTVSLEEWQDDLDFGSVAPTSLNGYSGGILCYKGFYDVYMSVRQQIWDSWNTNKTGIKNLFITGHSLGGALCTICAFDFADEKAQLIHYSFAAPRSGNLQYAMIFNTRVQKSLRVNNTEDIVPQLPPAAIKGNVYMQTAGNIPFTSNYGSLEKNHVNSYYEALPQCFPNITPICNCNLVCNQ